MPKLKTRKSVAKRFRLTRNGKVRKLGSANHSHLLSKKDAKRRRRHRAASFVKGAQAKSIKQMIRA